MAKFDSKFELEVLARAAMDPGFRASAKRVLQSHNFTDKKLGWVWDVMDVLSVGERLNGPLVIMAAKKSTKNEDERTAYMEVGMRVLKHGPTAPKAALKELSDFAQFQRLSAAMEKSIKSLDKGDVDGATAALHEARRVGDTTSYDSSDFMGTFRERMELRKARALDPSKHSYIATKIPALDKVLHGIEPGELGLVVATTGRGKSHFATHLSFWAGILGFNVGHIVTEMTKEQAITRFDSRLFMLPYDDLRFHRLDEEALDGIESRFAKIGARLMNKIQIASTPIRKATLDTLEQFLDDCASDGREIQMLVVDSGDHLRPSEYDKDRRNREASNYWDLKSLAIDRGIAVWTTAQASKEVVNKIARAENVAEAYDKARIADIMWTLNQSPSQAELGIMKGVLAKYRSGKTGIMVTMRTDLSRSFFEEVEDSEDPDHGHGDEDDDE